MSSTPPEITAAQYYAASLKIQFATYRVLALSRSPASPLFQTLKDLDLKLRAELEQLAVASCLGLAPPTETPEPSSPGNSGEAPGQTKKGAK